MNRFERDQGDDDSLDDKITLKQKAMNMVKKIFSQYNIFLLFMFKVWCEWYFGARITQQ
jgi:hypothetical protein